MMRRRLFWANDWNASQRPITSGRVPLRSPATTLAR